MSDVEGGPELYTWLLSMAAKLEKMGLPAEDVSHAYLQAWRSRPTRAEALWGLAKYLRAHGDVAQAWVYATAASVLRDPGEPGTMPEVYEWRALHERAAAAFQLGNVEDALACNELLLGRRLSDERRRIVTQNVAACRARLGRKAG